MRDLGKRFRSKVKPGSTGKVRLGQMWYQWNGVWRSVTDLWQEAFNGISDQTAYVPSSYNAIKAEYCWDDTHQGPPWSSGGPFSKVTVAFPEKQVIGEGTYERPGIPFSTGWPFFNVFAQWRGGFQLKPSEGFDAMKPYYGNVTYLLNTSGLATDALSWGPSAWAATAPKMEAASAFVALRESKDIPRMLQTSASAFRDSWRALGGSGISASMAPKKAADHFLNHEFGWLPFLSDLGKFKSAFDNTAAYMSRMRNGNGKWKVYRRTLVDESEWTTIHEGTEWVVNPENNFMTSHLCGGVEPKLRVLEKRQTLITSSGSFKWYKPEHDVTSEAYKGPLAELGRQMTMYGARISPSNVWRSTPWTWLVDWGLNVGQNIDRITEYLQDGVECKYLYVMAHDIRTLRFEQTLPMPGGPLALEYDRVIEIKQRQAISNPFGLGPQGNFGPLRLAILAALGVSRH